jgi:Flp pilus assembly protein TadD
MDPRDTREWQAPDLSTELTFADYRAGHDPAMDAILHYKPSPGVAELVSAAAEKNDSAAAKAAMLTFITDPLHKYASVESDINQLGYTFLNAKKFDQAILVLKLNAEIYPESFNTWDSLGEAYMDRGDKQLAIQNYRESLQLNPKNNNARGQLTKLQTP